MRPAVLRLGVILIVVVNYTPRPRLQIPRTTTAIRVNFTGMRIRDEDTEIRGRGDVGKICTR